jgi:hypothetical protein
MSSLAKIGVSVSELEAKKGSLDDAFVELTKDGQSKVSAGIQQ